MNKSYCSSCGAEIEWRITKNGRSIPINTQQESIIGNIVLVENDKCDVVSPGKGTHITHFATCPNAKKHRRTDR